MRLPILILTLIGIAAYHPRPAAPRYIFFLHNRFIEEHGPTDRHPSYGRAEYQEILTRFSNDGFIVLSEKRPSNTNAHQYAHRVVSQIDSLQRYGIPSASITVIGTSKGGYIAQFVSAITKNSRLNFVFIGSSFTEEAPDETTVRLFGRILSITEASDTGSVRLSTQSRFKRSRLAGFKEMILHTGLHHGFLFKALDAWILPAEQWARR